MILRTDITEAGTLNKPHGIKGELSVTVDPELDIDLSQVKCIVLEIEGIFVPFFISSVRPRSSETYLVIIDGIDSEQKARSLSGQHFYVLDRDLPSASGDDSADGGEEGFYISDLIGYSMVDSSLGLLGKITGYNDSTANLLLIVTDPDGREIFVPVAEEFIDSVDVDSQRFNTSLPSGLVELNKK